MKKKKTILLITSLTLVGGLLAAGFAVGGGSLLDAGAGISAGSAYQMVLDDTNQPTFSATATSVSSYLVRYTDWDYSLVKASTGAHAALASGGSLKNTTAINSTEKILVALTGTSTLTLKGSWTSTGTYNEITTFSSSVTELDGTNYPYLQFVNSGSDDCVITSLAIGYSCAVYSGSLLSGKVNNVNGAVEGATVSVVGTSLTTTTDASGNYSFASRMVAEPTYQISIAKTGYVSQTLTVSAKDTAKNVDLRLTPVTSGVFGMNSWNVDITRSTTAFEFVLTTTSTGFVTPSGGENTISIYLGFGTPAAARDKSSTLELKFNPDNWIGVWDYITSTWVTWTSDVAYSKTVSGGTTTLNVSITYAFITAVSGYSTVTGTDEIGITFGEWKTGNSPVWVGWSYDSVFSDPAYPTKYVRLTSANVLSNPA